MPVTEQPKLAQLVRETKARLDLSQVKFTTKFATKIGVSFQSVNRWENGRTKPLPLDLKQIEAILHYEGDRGEDLLAKYFPSEGS
ncbi:helix-turn-helix transcriptional regulator [Chroococcidiopsis sp. FACHB-1243]|uniref:helix-turn-helix domain-containing protein n=1 Tax=Chroococcidiopsis sp. [FACHB-1243] TaxID=2692781 RepID=UPI00177E2A56|nr:helix-turn-helix transcriptional regulator [Chroococcidiopsis sp. [FACHB-1243]]MBD2308980.1 helix-turn-helix transcriptional regulator [Chroococcidiopsis sp. [FACHB-1243]]